MKALKHLETKADYACYVSRVEGWLERNDCKPGCNGPAYDTAGNAPDPFFSWAPCDCCSRPLGGNRETHTFATNTNDTFSADICTDCVYFLAYGELDDQTMMDLKD